MNVYKRPLTKRLNHMLNIINHSQIPNRGLTKNGTEKAGFITNPKGLAKKKKYIVK